MRWMDWAWLLLGIGIGWMGNRMAQKRRKSLSSSLPAQTLAPENHQDLLEQLRQTELAYGMAADMARFKGTFLARTSHELRSPLNGMIGMLQLILADLCDGPEEEREFITQANASALKLVKLLDHVIDTAKVEHGTSKLDLQPVHVGQLLQEVYLLTHLQAANQNLQLQMPDLATDAPDPDPDPALYVLADPNRLRQALVSLIDTAIAEMTAGPIRLSLQSFPKAGSLWIAIEQAIPATIWDPPPDQVLFDPTEHNSRPRLNLCSASLPKIDLAHRTNQTVPSAAFTYLIAQKLVQSMQGQLEIVLLAGQPELGPTQLRCTLPLVVPEP